MNDQDYPSPLEDLTTSVAEARPLLTSFEILQETVQEQLRATKLTIIVLAMLLCMVVAILVIPISFSNSSHELVFAIGVVITFGLVSSFVIQSNLLACARNAYTAKCSLEKDLYEADDVVNKAHEKRFHESQSIGGSSYAI